MKAKSIKGKSPSEIQSALAESITDSFKSALTIVFITIKQDIEVIYDMLNNNDKVFCKPSLIKSWLPATQDFSHFLPHHPRGNEPAWV